MENNDTVISDYSNIVFNDASAREKLERQLMKGGSSEDKAKRDASNIINLAGQYTGEI